MKFFVFDVPITKFMGAVLPFGAKHRSDKTAIK